MLQNLYPNFRSKMKIKLCSLVSVKTIILLRMRRSDDVKMDSENGMAGTDREDIIMMFRHARMDTADLIRHSQQRGRNSCRLSGEVCRITAPSSSPTTLNGSGEEGEVTSVKASRVTSPDDR